MKTFLLTALIGLTTLNSYAQNKCNCPCKGKVVHHKVSAVHHSVSPEPAKESNLPPYVLVLPHVPNTYVPVPPATEACYSYTQHNIVVKECPGTFYDNSGNIEYNGQGTYFGYYPGEEKNADKGEATSPDLAPQHTVLNNYNGTAPADGNSCNGCSPQ